MQASRSVTHALLASSVLAAVCALGAQERLTPSPAPPALQPLAQQVRRLETALRYLGEPLSDADLGRTITIRGEAHSVMQAINRQLAHYANHVGQIVMLAKHFAGSQWKPLTIPRGKSAEFLQRVSSGTASQR